MKGQSISIPKHIQRQWLEIDASSQSLGRVSSKIANVLRGKHKRNFTPHMDCGDFVVAVNAGKLKLTGKKIEQKQYYHYTGYHGGIRTQKIKDLLQKQPDKVLRNAVFHMIDDNKLRKPMMRRLKIINDASHQFKIDRKI